MQPFRDGASWLKQKWKEHPHATGAILAVGATVAVLGTGGAALIVGVPLAAAGAGLSNAIASDPGKKDEEEKK
jgi:hypothetical protein